MDIVPTYVAPTAGAGCCSICRSGHKEPPRPRKLDQGRKLSEGAASVAETCSARTTAIILPREHTEDGGREKMQSKEFHGHSTCGGAFPEQERRTRAQRRAGSLLLFA